MVSVKSKKSQQSNCKMKRVLLKITNSTTSGISVSFHEPAMSPVDFPSMYWFQYNIHSKKSVLLTYLETEAVDSLGRHFKTSLCN